MNVDLIIDATPPLPPSGTATYARVDNTTNPVFAPSQTFSTVPFDLTPNGVPAGQYQIVVTPTFPDGRTCPPQTATTAPCPTMISVNAVQNGNNIVVSYVAPAVGPNEQPIPTVSILISGPNGSVYNAQFTNGTNNSQIVYPIPTGVYGTYTITMQAVCDPATGFFGPASPPSTVLVAAPVTAPVLNGQLVIVCGNNCGAQQNAALQFNLTQPLSADLTLQVAYDLHNTSGGGSYTQWGCSIIPPSYTRGTCGATGYATITIPAGVLSFTTPILQFPSPPANYGMVCFCTGDSGYSVFVVDEIFFHSINQPNIQIQLTPADSRVTIIQI